jgi:galactokinase
VPRLDAQTLFRRRFKFTPTHLIRAPASLELLGSQGLCADGLAVAVALDRHVEIATTPRPDGRIEFVSSECPDQPETFRVGDFQSDSDTGWLAGVKTALARLRARGVNLSGFSAAISNDFPAGTNFGHAAAREVALMLSVRQLFPFAPTESGLGTPPARDQNGKLPPLTPREKLLLAKWFEPHPNGRMPGSADVLSCKAALLGRAWHVLHVDLKFGTAEASSVTGEVLVVCIPQPVTGAETAALRGAPARGEGASPRELCESAAKHLGARSLRSVEPDMLKAEKSKLTPREFDCARHVVGEFSRLVAAERVLRNEEHKQFGEFMLQSHESRRDLIKDVSPDTELLVKTARVHPACLGARGCPEASEGATVNLVRHHQADAFAKQMAQFYEGRMGRALAVHVFQIADGGS